MRRLRTGGFALLLALATCTLAAARASAATPNDPSFALQWGDSNTGQSIPTQTAEGEEPIGPPANGTSGADDRALAAWDVSTGSRSIVIGALDSGVQSTHPDLAANIWSNPGGVGGCPAGTHGFDVLNSNCYPEDEDPGYGGHGTHVAGIMGAVGGNGVGVAGLNWTTSILPVKWVQSARGETDDLVDALKWLVQAKEEGVNVRVVNDSLTFFGTPYSAEVKSEIEALGAHNILFVTAAGNTGNNNDEESVRRYPCGYGLSNEICVTATNNRDELPTWANYGAHTVDLAAPGVSIYSTLRGGKYGYLSGGSMASAQVAGAAALILSVEPTFTAQELKADILGNVRALPALKGKVITGGTLDICAAMPSCALPRRPSVTTLIASSLTQTSVTLRASVNPNGREVSDCHFDYGTTSAYGERALCSPMPGNGTRPVGVSASLGGLNPHTSYHFRVVASNAGGSSVGADETFTTPPELPSVTTLSASSITQTAATMNGTVDPNSAEVSDCHFDFGRTSTYGESARCLPMPGSGTSPVEVSASIGGLTPGSTYHFRIVATNSDGTRTGADQMFTTQPIPSQEGPPAQQPLATGIPPAALTGVVQTTPPQYEPARPVPPVPILLSRVLTVNSSGLVRVILACPWGGHSCAGAIVLRVSSDLPPRVARRAGSHRRSGKPTMVAIASGRYAIPAGGATSMTLAVSSRGRRLLAVSRSVHGQATLLAEDLVGASLPTAVPVTLTARAARSQPRGH